MSAVRARDIDRDAGVLARGGSKGGNERAKSNQKDIGNLDLEGKNEKKIKRKFLKDSFHLIPH